MPQIERTQWVTAASRLVLQLREALTGRDIDETEILFVLIARGGLILLPALLNHFQDAKIAVVSCDRSNGITGVMPLPTDRQKVLIVLDAVIATGGTIKLLLKYLRRRVLADEIWVGSLSCTDIGREMLRSEGCVVYAEIDDTMQRGAPTKDLGGADAGELFQGFAHGSNDNQGLAFAKVVGDDSELSRRASIHAAVLNVVRSLSPRRVLDLGCGDGALSHKIAEFAEEVVASDPDGDILGLAVRNHSAESLRYIEWSSLPAEGEFDVINACMVLNAADDVGAFLRNAVQMGSSTARHVWTILHPSFSFDESINIARRAFESGVSEAQIRVGIGYLVPHQYNKTRGGIVVRNYHRPMSWYVSAFNVCGLTVEAMIEPPPLGEVTYGVLPRVATFVTKSTRNSATNKV